MSKPKINRDVKIAQIIFKITFLFILSALTIVGQTATETGIRPLTIETPIERELKSDEVHSYSLSLQAGQFLNVVVEQKGIDVVVAMFDAEGKKLAEVDSPNGTQGAEPLSVIIEKTGNYRLEVRSLEKDAPAGKYEAKIAELRAAKDTDKNKLAAQKWLGEAVILLSTGTAESRREAIKKFEAALPEYRIAQDKKGEAETFSRIGSIYFDLGEKQKSIDYYLQALPLFRSMDDKRSEGESLHIIGIAYFQLGEKQKAIDYYTQALPPRRISGDKVGEAQTLNNIGWTYHTLGERQKALDFYTQSLPLRRIVGDKSGEAQTLGNIANIYAALHDREKALDNHLQSLALYRAVGNKLAEAAMLSLIGWNYFALSGEPQIALDYYTQALSLSRAIGDKGIEAVTLGRIGWLNANYFNNQQKALDYYRQALPLSRVAGNKGIEANILSNTADTYKRLGEVEKALDYYNQSLTLDRAVGWVVQEGDTLRNIGDVHNMSGNRHKALEFYSESLKLFKTIGDKREEGVTLFLIGNVYYALEQKEKAFDYYIQALPLHRAVGNKRYEAHTFYYISKVFASANPRLSVFYHKYSVNNNQILRSNLQKLDKNAQQGFLKTIEPSYRSLADALIMQNRRAEALQVLNIFKDQQFFDFNQSTQPDALALTAREAELTTALNEKLEKLVEAIRALDDFQIKRTNRNSVDEQEKQLESLKDKRTAANEDFLAFIKTAEREFAVPPDEKDKIPPIAGLIQMQKTLRELSAATNQKTVAVYQLVGEKTFKVIIVTSDSIKSVSTPTENNALNEKSKQLWGLLQSDKYDVTKLSKEIYDVVFAPLEKELPKNTKTIMWSMDGNLRYVPMAALFDGERYLVERYNNVVFTRADSERMTRKVSNVWTGTGFGSTKAQSVELSGEKVNFTALPGVTEELKEIFKIGADDKSGIIKGEVLPDEKFNQTAMLAALKEKRPLVHIASHFNFISGDEARSFLLMGDGTAFTLDEMKRQTDMFAGVELLTLSACNTAAQQPDANGREVDGFAELAQRLGAGAVMATLWSVADNSTPWLMRDFYSNRQQTKDGMTKADALRQAQLALLSGTAKTKPLPFAEKGATVKKLQIEIVAADETRDKNQARSSVVFIDKADAPLYKKNEKKPFAHPYYWSPFILVGNWK